jgi:outer membrane receptor protein involved in Fe transport
LPAFDVNNAIFREYTGHATVDWTPKFDFTDQTLIYATFSRGYKAGGFNPGVEADISVPQTYAPEFINDYELGTKNTLLNGTLQANADLWYYDYTGLQVSEIENNTSVNQNINSKLYGAEGEFVYQPIDQLQFGLNIAETHTGIANGTYLVDPRNPTGGDPKTVLVKDDTITASSGENCVLYWAGAGNAPSPATLGIPGFTNPNGGTRARFLRITSKRPTMETAIRARRNGLRFRLQASSTWTPPRQLGRPTSQHTPLSTNSWTAKKRT